MKVVLAHWFNDAVKPGVVGLPMTVYELSEPIYLKDEIGEEDGIGGEKENARKN